MNIYAQPGSQVRFLDENGHDYDKAKAHKFLKKGKVYTVAHTEVGNWHTDVFLVEVPGEPFNSVMFDDEGRP